MGFEELLDQAGGFGPFQLRNMALLALPRMILSMNFLLPIFLAAVPAHHCALPGAPANFSHRDAWLEAYLPREPDGTFSSCLRFTHPQAPPNTTSNATLWGEGRSPGEPQDEPSTVLCPQGWEYDHSDFSSTIVTEWDLVCEKKGLNRVSSTFFFIGVLVGSVTFGYLSDRYGRRRLLLVAYVNALTMGLASVAAANYIMFVITRTLTGAALAGFTIIVMPLELEWLDVRHRTVAGVLSSSFWSGGVMMLALAGYLIRDWRWLQLAVILPCVAGILSLWWVPESARWLLTQGRVDEAHRYLLCCARLNGRPVGEDGLSLEALSKVAAAEREVRKPSYLMLFQTSQLRAISLCCMVVWFAANISYYGLSMDLSGLGLDIYQMQLLFGAIEIPSKFLVYLFVQHAGRRLTQAGMMLGISLTSGCTLLVSTEMVSWSTVLAVMGKGFSNASFTTVYLFTSELYPTVLRQTGMGMTALVGRLGGSLAPLVALLDDIWQPLPKLIYGGIALLAACIALLLPETKQAQLPESIQDVERKRAPSHLQEEEMLMKQVQD